ncbi:MAG: hypothetical protein JJ891_04965 [Rhizobiaceae bacterium]|jgi:hypothetical protein|nr:hypothetical protein [Rhizobiaceae bacterium]
MSDKLTTFLGDSPARVIVKLLVISFVVGVLLSYFNFTPYEIWLAVKEFFVRLWELGFDAIGKVGQYLLAGALVVVPVFFILRFMKLGR